MKILFVCKWNVGRSQIAKALFNKYSKKHQAISAGTHAEKYVGVKLLQVSPYVIQCMNEWGYDLSNCTQTPLTKKVVNQADKIIFITDKKNLPDYLQNSNKIIFWEIEDRAGKDYVSHVVMRDQIDKLVKNLISQIG